LTAVDLAVVMPVYNEAEIIAKVVGDWSQELERVGIRYEFHVYNDGSRDNTAQVLAAVAENNSHVFVHSGPNQGHGPTLIQAYRENAARAPWILQIDSDDEIFPSSLGEFWKQRSDYDFIIGRRTRSGQPWARALVSRLSLDTIRTLYGTCLHDVNCPFRLMRTNLFKDIFHALPEDTFAPNILIAGMAGQHQLRVCELPIAFQHRKTGKGSLLGRKLLLRSWKAFRQTVAFKYRRIEENRGEHQGFRPTLSLIIPVYNYASKLKGNINRAVHALRGRGLSFEIILVNDGSRDKTGEEIVALSQVYPEVKSLSYSPNRGKGYAVKEGILQAEGWYVFFTDVDLPYGVDPIVAGLLLLQAGEVGAVLGERHMPGLSKHHALRSQRRAILREIFSVFVNGLLQLGVKDTQCGLKGFKREIAQQVFPRVTRTDFSFDVEVILLLRKMGCRFSFVRVEEQHSDVTTVHVLRDGFKMLYSVVVIFLKGLKLKKDVT